MNTNNVLNNVPETAINIESLSDENFILETELFEDVIEFSNIKLSLVPSKRKKVKKINIIIEGNFNVTNVSNVKDQCQRLLQYFDVINISLKNIEDIDLASIQLLHLLSSKSELMQKTITIESDLSKDNRALLIGAGLLDVLIKTKL